MPKSSWPAPPKPPRVDNTALQVYLDEMYELLIEWFDHSYGLGEIASGRLDSDNIINSILIGFLLVNGTAPLTANWDVGAFKITVLTLESDVAAGTAPFVVASNTLVANLNAALLNGQTFTTAHNAVSGSHSGLKQAAALTDASISGVSIGTADADVTYGTAERDLINELKSDVNTLITDVNNAIGKLNSLYANLRTAALQAT